MIIRYTTSEDIPAIYSLYNKVGIKDQKEAISFPDKGGMFNYQPLISFESHIINIVAEIDGYIVGYFSIKTFNNKAFGNDILVEPGYKGKGIGKSLSQAMMSILVGRNILEYHITIYFLESVSDVLVHKINKARIFWFFA